MSFASCVHELMCLGLLNKQAAARTFLTYLEKTGQVTQADIDIARDALEQKEIAEKGMPKAEQAARYALLGGLGSVGVSMLSNAIKGGPVIPTTGVSYGKARNVAGDFVRGAVGGVGLNLVQRKVDESVANKRLQNFVAKVQSENIPVVPKEAAALTPAGRLAQARKVGMTPGSLGKGPGIDKQMGPRGAGSGITIPAAANSTKEGI